MFLLKDLTRHMTLLFSMMSHEPPLSTCHPLGIPLETSQAQLLCRHPLLATTPHEIHRPSCSSSVTFSLLPSAHLLNFRKACSTPSHRRPNRSLLAPPHHTSYTSPVFSGTTWLSCFAYSLRETSYILTMIATASPFRALPITIFLHRGHATIPPWDPVFVHDQSTSSFMLDKQVLKL